LQVDWAASDVVGEHRERSTQLASVQKTL
jgi:hypothetical protein